MNIAKKENKALQSFSPDVNITLAYVTNLYDFMNKEKKLKEILDLTKIKTRGDDERYYIYINRKQHISNSYQGLIEKLYNIYYGDSIKTLDELFPDWLIWRRDFTKVSNKTIKENIYLWNSLYKDKYIVKLPLSKLKVNDFIKFFREQTKDMQITRKRFNDGKSILNSIIYYAIEKEIIEHNPLNDINYKIFAYKPVNDKDNVYTLEEREKILEYVKSKNDIYSLAIQLHFHLVLRIGELKALKWSNISDNYIRIQNQILDEQTMNDDLSFNKVTKRNVEYLKGKTNYGFRNMPLTPKAKEILIKIKDVFKNESEYILYNYDKPLTTVTYNRHLKNICKKINIEYKSSHKIRFTVASMLYQNGIKETKLQEWLGHSTLGMTLHYLRNISVESEDIEKMNKALG